MNRPSFIESRRIGLAALAAAAWSLLICWPGSLQAAEAAPADRVYQIAAKRSSDQVTVRDSGERVVFVVESRTGIGRAEITRCEAAWPPAVVIRLALRGLEDFRVKAGDTELGVAVSSHGEGERVRVWRTSDERVALAADDPLFPQVRFLDQEGRPTDKGPPEIAAIEIALPAALLKNQPKAFEFSWIDFYR